MKLLRRRRTQSVSIKSAHELALMRYAGQIVAEVHAALRETIQPGVTTFELNRLTEEIIRKRDAVPSFLGYPHPYGKRPFPASICTSINEELVHGIPSKDRVLQEGDIISVDVGAIYRGYHGDSAWTYAVGEISPEAQKLLEVTEAALYAGIAQIRARGRLRDFSAAVQAYVEPHSFNIVREYGGHGIGSAMHEPPQILNYVTDNKMDGTWLLRPGMTFALEPMVNTGSWRTRTLRDGWTVVTADSSLSAHFEHTIVVTEDKPQILTLLR